MNYAFNFSGNFCHTINVSAETKESAEIQAYQILDRDMLFLDDYAVEFSMYTPQAPVYTSLKSFFALPEKEPEKYTSLSSFYAPNTSDYNRLYN